MMVRQPIRSANQKSGGPMSEPRSRLAAPCALTRALAAPVAALCSISSLPEFADDDPDDLRKAVKKPRLIDLSHNWENSSPVASVTPPYSFALSATHENTRG